MAVARLCFGIYDANCDGPSYENPVKIVKAAEHVYNVINVITMLLHN